MTGGRWVPECIAPFFLIVELGCADHAVPEHVVRVVMWDVGGGRANVDTSCAVNSVVSGIGLVSIYFDGDVYHSRLVDGAGMVVVDRLVVEERGLDKRVTVGRCGRVVEVDREGTAVHFGCCEHISVSIFFSIFSMDSIQ